MSRMPEYSTRCGGLQNVSRPISMCQAMSQEPPSRKTSAPSATVASGRASAPLRRARCASWAGRAPAIIVATCATDDPLRRPPDLLLRLTCSLRSKYRRWTAPPLSTTLAGRAGASPGSLIFWKHEERGMPERTWSSEAHGWPGAAQSGDRAEMVGRARAALPAPLTRRALVQGALLAGGAAALAACGQAQSTATQPSTSTGGAPKGTVEFWQWGVVYVDGFDTLTKEFNAKGNGITINFVPAVTDGYWDKLTAAMSANTGPDVYLMNTNARTWATKGLMRPLDDLIKKDKTAADENQSTIKSFRDWYDVGGKQMGWPWDYSTIVTAYNVAHLREAGLKPPAELGEKWDWNTFKDYAQ